jgi:branched-subunit amino acid aminotransferase/4-amino-4-deoxychorismate lyase
LQDTARVVTAQSDHRTSPLVKGPDLAAGVVVRDSSGQDEAVILSEGMVVEGVYSSLVWWKNDQLFSVPTSIPRLPSITERIIVETAERLGTSILEQQIKPMELEDAELWLLSALHGIRTVTGWVGGPKLKIEPGRVEYWRTMRGLYKEKL